MILLLAMHLACRGAPTPPPSTAATTSALPPAAPVPPPPADVLDAILLRTQTRAQAEELAARLRAGEDAEALARARSDDPSAGRGGRMGMSRRDRVAAPIADGLAALPFQGVLDPVAHGGAWWTGTRREPAPVVVTWAQIGHRQASRGGGARDRDTALALAAAVAASLHDDRPIEGADRQGRDALGPGQWSPDLYAAAAALSPGQVSPPIDTALGLFVLRREAVMAASPPRPRPPDPR